MAEYAVAQSDAVDSEEAGKELGQQLAEQFGSALPDAVVVFSSAQYEYGSLLRTLEAASGTPVIVGASSAGEFTGVHPREHSACAIGIYAPEMLFSAGVGRGVSRDPRAAADAAASAFRGDDSRDHPYHSALILTDALAGHAETLVEQFTLRTGGSHQLVGGGAGDDARFERTHVFHGTEAVNDAVVALEILSPKPVGIGVEHGWKPIGDGMRVTASNGTRLISLNAMPAVQAFEEHAKANGQSFDTNNPLPFFLHNVLGIDTGTGHKLRVPLGVDEYGSVICAAEVPVGSTVHIMGAACNPAESAQRAVGAAISQIGENEVGAALFFDCVATRLRTGRDFGLGLQAIEQALGGAPFAGCNTYGQIARAKGQFSGFHNCTAVVCVLPR